MVSLVSRSGSIASRRTVQIGTPSLVVACRSLSLKSARGLAAPHTRNWTPLVSIRMRIISSSRRVVAVGLLAPWRHDMTVLFVCQVTRPSRYGRLDRQGGKTGMPHTPITQQITDDLRKKIEDGTYGPGALLPSETELAAKYEVSRQTGRSALRALEQEGLIVVHSTRG